MTALFVTSTGTDIGKTFVTRAIIHKLRSRGRSVDALKPVITGFDPATVHASDTGRLLSALGRTITPDQIDAISPYRLRDPVSPDLASRREGSRIGFTALADFCRKAIVRHVDALIIEGVGGIMAPLDDHHTVLDWMIEIDLPLITVVGSYVGSLSHTLSAFDVLDHNDLKVAAIVVSETPGSAASIEDTVATIERFATGTQVLGLPRLPDGTFEHPTISALADLL